MLHLLNISLLSLLSTCSFMDGIHSALNRTNEANQSEEFISKDKYERLLVKYESLKIERKKNYVPTIQDPIPKNLEEEILFLRKAIYEIDDNEEKIRLLLVIINSENGHVRARVNYNLAKIFESIDECDQSLSLVDELVNFHAFSGIVIPALALGVRCADKLKLKSRSSTYVGLLERFL